MKDINKVILIGRLGVAPVLKTTAAGMPYAKFTVATNRMLKDLVPVTRWHRLVVWGKLAESCTRYLKKGQAVYVEGELRSNDYQDKDGIDRTSFDVHVTEISFLGFAKGESKNVESDIQPVVVTHSEVQETVLQ